MTKIEWTEQTWNPIVGCSIVSPGCTNCYAMRMAARIEAMKRSHYDGTTKRVNGNPVWTGKVALAPDHILLEPLRRKKPTLWFVNSMGDLFHEDAPDAWIDKVFAVMALTPQHTYQVLTKRAERMREYVANAESGSRDGIWRAQFDVKPAHSHPAYFWPLPNVWLGVSAERQKEADERIPLLMQTPAAVRFISAEPLLGPIDVTYLAWAKLDWVICGGESGHGARPMHPDWPRKMRDQCAAAGIPFFFKQWGEWEPGDGDCAGQQFYKVGKKAAGRTLDGKIHDAMPGAMQREAM